MVVGINDNFKIPIAYFFVNKISGEEKANIVLEALRQLSTAACKIVSITYDGPNVHIKMMQELGYQVTDLKNVKNYFLHPVTQEKVFIIFTLPSISNENLIA
ncbi:hypothetical protein JTB14_023059 [Gonioctena quinquepunctata]|nr:hypothetical protein JTB14_023059 [Gonioctena quinquepunctata]